MRCVKCGRYGQALSATTSLDAQCIRVADCEYEQARLRAQEDALAQDESEREEADLLRYGGRAPVGMPMYIWRSLDDENLD